MKHDRSFARIIIGCALAATALCVLSLIIYCIFPSSGLLSLVITAGTTAYHFVMRLAAGWIIPLFTRGRLDPNGFLFRSRSFERPFYRALRVRRWKKKMHTYSPQEFSMEENTPEQIIQNSCVAELVHWTIAVASFIPLLAARFWGALPVFIATSVLAAGFDCCFVIMQRYNRPRFQQYLRRRIAQNTTKRS